MTQIASKTIRIAQTQDAQDILDIYAPYITDTAITFTSTLPQIQDVQKKMENIKTGYPYLVCTIDDKVVGFAFADLYKSHDAYQWNTELSVYVDPRFHGRGIATALYTALFQILKTQGFYNFYALITLPNDASIALHRHFGFKELAVHKQDGYKMGAWRDVLWMVYRNEGAEGAEDPGESRAPVPFSKLRESQVQTALRLSTALLQGVR